MIKMSEEKHPEHIALGKVMSGKIFRATRMYGKCAEDGGRMKSVGCRKMVGIRAALE